MKPKDCLAAGTSVIFYPHVRNSRDVCVCVCGSGSCLPVCINKANPLCVSERTIPKMTCTCCCIIPPVCIHALFSSAFSLSESAFINLTKAPSLVTGHLTPALAYLPVIYVDKARSHETTRNLYIHKEVHSFAPFLGMCLIVVFTACVIFITLHLPVYFPRLSVAKANKVPKRHY